MKKGFTLIEILAIIVLIGILVVIVVPNVTTLLFSNRHELGVIQKQQLKSAVEMYIADYCTEPLSDSYECAFTTEVDTLTGIIYVKSGSMKLEDFAKLDYMDEELIKKNCKGTITIDSGEIDLSKITCEFKK